MDSRFPLLVFAAGTILFVLLVGLGVVTPTQFTGRTSQTQPPAARHDYKARDERQQLEYLELKVGECDSRGGVAKVDPLAGYLGCDLPVLRTHSR
jgi:hypothetical protein